MPEAKGIDLGTTNSSVAVLRGMTPSVYRNNENQECTPSAVWVDREGSIRVGRLAKQRAEADPDNVKTEFKRNMGKSHAYPFTDSGRTMKPEELSAEVLKSLRRDVERAGDTLDVVAIGVPAFFDLDSCKATERACTAAGFRKCPHVQEPVAAALAYGFDRQEDKVTWLVYDLGGGTFDTALVTLHDGEIRVLRYRGDKHLGGKDIDWKIVNQILVPALLESGYKLTDFRFGPDHPKWTGAFAKLKARAEEAKILLSVDDSASINIEPLCQDDRGDWVTFNFILTRKAAEPLIEPYVRRSVELVRELLAAEGLGPDSIAKMILVGGPTRTPLVRKALTEEFGIDLECGVDPLTVVAQGAAIFAAGLADDDAGRGPAQVLPAAGTYVLRTDFKSISQDEAPDLIGRVEAPDGKAPPEKLTIEVVEETSGWRSDRQLVDAKGRFQVTGLRAARGRENRFRIELCDAGGSPRDVFPAVMSYRVGNRPGEQILIHSVGLALKDNRALVLIEQGKPLSEAKATETVASTVRLLPRDAETVLRIPLIEGEARLADRNRWIGELVVRGEEVEREVPLGSDVEVTLEVDQSRQLTARAYIPLLDRTLEKVVELEGKIPPLEEIIERHRKEADRLEKTAERVKKVRHEGARTKVEEARQALDDVGQSLGSASGDSDTPDRCHNRLLQASIALDEAGELIKTPEAMAELREHLSTARELATLSGTGDESARIPVMEGEVKAAIATGDPDVIASCQDSVMRFVFAILSRIPEFWMTWLDSLEARQAEMPDQDLARQLFAKAQPYRVTRDASGLEACCQQLAAMLPDPPPPPTPKQWMSGIDKKLF